MKIIKLIAGFLICAVAGIVIPTHYELPVSYITATAEEVGDFSEKTIDMLTYHKYADHIKIVSCNHIAEGEMNIPETIEELPVTVIGAYAFNECNFLKSVILPENVESIETCAFYKCENLEYLTIKNPNCAIENRPDTICNNSDENNERFYFNGSICCNKNSIVQSYAQNYNYNFIDIDPVVVEPTSPPTEPINVTESESTETTTTTTTETTTSEGETTTTISQTTTASTKNSTVKKTTNTANTSTTTTSTTVTAAKTTGWTKPSNSPQTDQEVPTGLKLAWGVLTVALIGLVLYTRPGRKP